MADLLADPATAIGVIFSVMGLALFLVGFGLGRQGGDDDETGGPSDHTEAGVAGSAPPDGYVADPDASLPTRLFGPLATRIEHLVATIGPADHHRRVRRALTRAGLDGHRRPNEVMGAQLIGGVVGAAIGTALALTTGLSAMRGVLVLIVFTLLGFAMPMIWLGRRGEAREARIREDLPDVLDLLAVSVEAGLGLDGAMALISDRLSSPVADEMGRALREMELGQSRRDALDNMRRRMPIPEVSSFVQSLIQATILGMPLAKVLKVQATEIRERRRQWARERASKLPVKVLLPLIACIFPAILVIVLGPVVSNLGGKL